ncbi:hypothetical protein JHL18_14650 [Clostridium sp. YIM B02505]|uniref:Uncharacterized protein n=1 Tax=Clostridium yunnanense TaxID=2800325 RepID=A0ABS1ERF8_9CLOT|nr:hypothetical protein [Clostridium yunnanense]
MKILVVIAIIIGAFMLFKLLLPVILLTVLAVWLYKSIKNSSIFSSRNKQKKDETIKPNLNNHAKDNPTGSKVVDVDYEEL